MSCGSCGGCAGGCSVCKPMATNPVFSNTKPRSLVILPGETVRLGFLFRGADGQPYDTDVFPFVTIIDTQGNVVIGPTSQGVFKTEIGEYWFDFTLDLNPGFGVWRDVWDGVIDGIPVHGEGTFQINNTQLPATNSDGFTHLGDEVGFCYSQNAICNINKLLKALKRRLKSSGMSSSCDEFGNIVYKPCDIFSTDELVTFLADALTGFNEIPTFTMFTFDDTEIISLYFDVLVQGALYRALAAQALIERGREFSISDNGLGFNPPSVSELLNTQYQKEMDNWYDKVKIIKANMRPSPIGLGGMHAMGTSPQFRRLRHLRARRIY